MKIIQALKKIKELRRKQDDLTMKVKKNAATMSYQTLPYGEKQAEVVAGWVQAIHDISAEIIALTMAINKTNLVTEVEIELAEGLTVNRPIAEWILRRRMLANADYNAWAALSVGSLREGTLPGAAGAEAQKATIVRHYDEKTRDEKCDLFRTEPMRIDATMEIVNATTDLVE